MKDSALSVSADHLGPLFSDSDLLARTLRLGRQSYFVYDPERDAMFWPEETYRLWGLDPKTSPPVDRSWVLETVHPDDVEVIRKAFNDPTWDETSYEYRIFLPDGSMRHIRNTSMRDRDSSGQIIKVFGLLRDATSERIMAGELSAQRTFLDLAIRSTNIGVWEVNLDTLAVEGNAQITKLLGYEPGELEMKNTTWDELCHPDDQAERKAVLDRVFAGESDTYDHEYRLRHRSGGYVWVLVNGKVVERHADGRPRLMAGTTLDITARKESEKELGEQNELLSLSLRMGGLGYLRYDVETDAIYWPPDTFRLWGLEPRDEPPTREWIVSHIHPEDRDAFVAQMADKTWTDMESSYRILHEDGTVRHIRSQNVRQLDATGKHVSSYGIYQDITRFQQMQSALVEGEARFRSLFETAGAGVVIADCQGTIHYINQAYGDMLGYESADLLGRSFAALAPSDEPDPVMVYADDLRSGTRTSLSIEKRYAHRDGHDVWVRLNVNVADGLGMGERMLVGVAQDITERREAELRLRESSQLLEEAQRLGKIGHWTWIPETGAIEWSSQMYRILGLDPEQPQLPVTPFREFIHEDDRGKWDEALQAVVNDNASQSLEFRLIRADGKVRFVAGQALAEETAAGTRRLLGTIQDLTERKRSEEVLQRAIDTAESANRAKSKFLASMSHELRTPLNAILGFAQLLALKTRGPLNDDQKGYVDNIVQGGDHLLGLINDVLDLARIDTGQLSVTIETVDAIETVDRVMKNFHHLAAGRNIRMAVDSDAPQRLPVQADRMRLTQVLVNLTSNAIKYNREHGAVQFSVSVTEDGYGRIGVSDTGRGIPEARRHEVFQSFNRLGAEASGEEGTGIGLTLSKSLIEQMDGRIGFESKDQEGTLFWIDLPLPETANTD